MELIPILSIASVLAFAVTNGMKDGSNVTATAIASRSFTRLQATLIVIVAELFGPYLLGTRVAVAVTRNIVSPAIIQPGRECLVLILCGVAGALVWNCLTWLLRLPSSSSMTLVGGLIGPFLFRFGIPAVPWMLFFLKVLLAMLISPFLGIVVGLLCNKIVVRLLSDASPRLNALVKKAQVITLVILGVNHGTNDSQKSMGIIALLLFAAGRNATLAIPFWVKLATILAIVLGIALGGTKILRTVGYGIFKLQPHHSLESQLAASSILLTCNLIGAPVSTTQILSSSVVGVGCGFRWRSVHWVIIRSIILSWIFTIPAAGLMGVLGWLTIGKLLM